MRRRVVEMEGEALVTAETYSTELQLHDTQDIARYRQVLDQLRTAAAPDAAALIRTIAAD